MIDADVRNAIYQLHLAGTALRDISRQFKVSRNAVRRIIRQQGALPRTVRKDKIQIDPDLLRRLYDECEGWMQRMHEKLVEEEKIQVSYPTLTRLLRELNLSRRAADRCDRVPDEPGVEMQHDTTVYRVKLSSQPTRVIASLLYPNLWEIETFPFSRQPKLNRKRIMSLYDSFDYLTKQQNIVWLGPTGCGKTGLASSFLLQAIDRGYRGYFISFADLVAKLYASLADHSQEKVIRKYAAYDCLVIDEVGYVEVEAAQVGLFFTLMHRRHKTKTTLLTSNLGFSEWGSFLKNPQLTSALLDRLTETSHVINMKNCRSLRDRLDNEEGGEKDLP